MSGVAWVLVLAAVLFGSGDVWILVGLVGVAVATTINAVRAWREDRRPPLRE